MRGFNLGPKSPDEVFPWANRLAYPIPANNKLPTSVSGEPQPIIGVAPNMAGQNPFEFPAWPPEFGPYSANYTDLEYG